jgi:hypothetical protein
MIILIVAAFLLSACGPAASAVNLYNEGQTKYVGANKAYADFALCQTIENQNIEQTFQLYYGGLWFDVQQKEQYRAAMNAPAEAAALAPKATTEDGTQVIDFNKLPANASPDNIYKSGLSFSVFAVTEAQIIPVAPEMFKGALDAVQVSNNHKFQCGTTWNNAAADYNLWRRQAAGRVVGDLANYFHIEDMPKELPMFTAAALQPGAAPNTTNPYAPTVAP